MVFLPVAARVSVTVCCCGIAGEGDPPVVVGFFFFTPVALPVRVWPAPPGDDDKEDVETMGRALLPEISLRS